MSKMTLGRRSWVVHWLDGKTEVHEEYGQEDPAQRRARSLGGKVVKVYRHDMMVENLGGPWWHALKPRDST